MAEPRDPNPEAEKFEVSRLSKSEQASFDAELARLRAMTVEQRVKMALSLRYRFGWLKPAPIKESK